MCQHVFSEWKEFFDLLFWLHIIILTEWASVQNGKKYLHVKDKLEYDPSNYICEAATISKIITTAVQ